MNKKKVKILFLFLLVNYIHLTPTSILFFRNISQLREVPLFFSAWSVCLVLLWLLFPIYLLVCVVRNFLYKKNFISINFLNIYLVVVYLLLFPLYYFNIDEIIFSSVGRTLLMIGKFGLFQVWASALVFAFTTGYLVSNLLKYFKHKKDSAFKN